jgi:replicative DNA helicase
MQGYTEPSSYEELLGMFLKEPNLFGDYGTDLDKEHFYEYGWLFDKMKVLHEKDALTIRTLTELMPDKLSVIQSLYQTVITTRLIDEKVQAVKRLFLKNQMKFVLSNAIADLEELDTDDAYRKVVRKLDTLTTSDVGGLINQTKGVNEWLAWIEQIRTDPASAYGLMTGLYDFDLLTTGLHRHDLSVVGARTSMGKSAFMIEMVLRLAQKGYKTAIFSLEMTRKQILNRMIANATRTPLRDIKKGEIDEATFRMIKNKTTLLEQIYIDDTRGVNADYITDVMRMLKRKQGLDFVVVDYLQDVKERGEENDNQGSALGRICRKLRKGAYDSDCHVMCLSQVRREVEQRNDKRPGNSDLSGSTGIETSADVIALLYRDEYYNPKTDKQGIIEVNFTKQRNGQLGRVELKYDKDIQRMYGQYEQR